KVVAQSQPNRFEAIASAPAVRENSDAVHERPTAGTGMVNVDRTDHITVQRFDSEGEVIAVNRLHLGHQHSVSVQPGRWKTDFVQQTPAFGVFPIPIPKNHFVRRFTCPQTYHCALKDVRHGSPEFDQRKMPAASRSARDVCMTKKDDDFHIALYI